VGGKNQGNREEKDEVRVRNRMWKYMGRNSVKREGLPIEKVQVLN